MGHSGSRVLLRSPRQQQLCHMSEQCVSRAISALPLLCVVPYIQASSAAWRSIPWSQTCLQQAATAGAWACLTCARASSCCGLRGTRVASHRYAELCAFEMLRLLLACKSHLATQQAGT